MQYAPIALFVYSRLGHTRQTVDALQKNHLAGTSELFVFSDGPKDKEAEERVLKVKGYIKTITGFKKVTVIERDHNLGLAQSIITGVSELIAQYDKVIVLEDDLVTSPYFLEFINDGLTLYENDKKVISVCGYMYPITTKHKEETVFFRIPDCWGWGTWKRGWDLFEPDANRLLEQIESKKMARKFNLNGGYDFLQMLKKQARNKVFSWAICWYASSLLNDKLSLHPAKSLVRNIGFDDLGTHCSYNAGYDVDIFQRRVAVSEIPIEEDRHTIKKIEMFFRVNQFKKLGYIIRRLLTSIP